MDYSVKLVCDYVVILCNPIWAHNEDEAIAQAEQYLVDCGINIDYANYRIDIEPLD